MTRLKIKKYNMISIEKQLKYQPYHQVKYVNTNILLVKIYYHLTNNKQIEQAKFTYSPLGKAFEKQIKTIEDQGKKQVDALKVLEPKAIESGSENNNKLVTQEIYNKILEERMDKILEVSKEINYSNLVLSF